MAIRIGSLTLNSRVYVPPMAGVTDMVFRGLVRAFDRNCMLATEMVSSRALLMRPEARQIVLKEYDHPIGIQLFGHEPDVMAEAALIAQAHGPDFIEINMGCPVPKITRGQDGCALMKDPALAEQIVAAVRSVISLPLTVKFRLGWDDRSRTAVEFAKMLESAGACAVTVHGRTRQQLYSGSADWDFIGKVKQALTIPVFGNGDVFEPQDAVRMLEMTGCDGVAVARGTLGNPWLPGAVNRLLETGQEEEPLSLVERLVFAYKHALGLIRYKGPRVGVNESRRHLVYYTKGISGAAPYRARLTRVKSIDEISLILAELADKAVDVNAKEQFLLAVQKNNLEDGEHPACGDGYTEQHVKPPVDLPVVVHPVAVPQHGVGERCHEPTHDPCHEGKE